MQAPTPWRRMLYKKFESLELIGKTLDLGGSRKSGYHEIFKGPKNITVVNLDQDYGFDMKFDLEGVFPINDNSFETILCINTLEHVFNYKKLISESWRVLSSKEGQMIIAVPFLMNIHPCPHDFWRYSRETLELIFKEAGFTSVQIQNVGTGPFSASLQLIYPFLKFAILRNVAYWVVLFLDWMVSLFSHDLSERYPLGYLVVARKYEK